MWQQDNSPSHPPNYTIGFLNKIVPTYLVWPPKSPDLSPIEQVWAYIKKRLSGKRFQNKVELFQAIKNEWQNIPIEKLHNYYSSFLARCYICRKYNGENLNGKWKEIKEVRGSYRTHLFIQVDENSGKTFIYEH